MSDTTDSETPAFRGERAELHGDGAGLHGEGAGVRDENAGRARWAAAGVSGVSGVSGFAAGAVAGGLGLGVPVAVVLLLWIGSPFPDSGPGGALHVGAGLWLLAQGAELVRTQPLSGHSAPIALTPLLLSVLPAWLLYRCTASVVAAQETETATVGGRTAVVVAGRVLGGYLAVAAVTVAYAARGPLPVDPPTALYVPLFAATAVGCGAWAGCGRPLGWLRGYGEEVAVALRAAGVAGGLLLGGGALLGGMSLAWHAGAAGSTYAQLSGPVMGRVPVLLTAVTLVPNLAVWGAAYALGVGFSAGTGTTVAPAGVSGHPVLPEFPLLAAVPGPGSGALGWAALVVPAGAGGALAWCAGRMGWRAGRTLRLVCAAAILYGVGLAVLAAWSGGPLGTGRLARFGPTWWSTGGSALGWALGIGVPGALALRSRYARAHPPNPPHSAHPWRTLVRSLRPAPPAPALPTPVPPSPLSPASRASPASPVSPVSPSPAPAPKLPAAPRPDPAPPRADPSAWPAPPPPPCPGPPFPEPFARPPSSEPFAGPPSPELFARPSSSEPFSELPPAAYPKVSPEGAQDA